MKLSCILWTATAMILGFLCLIQAGVMLSLLTSRAVLPLVVPTALVVALVIGDRLGRREGLSGRMRLVPVGLTLGLTVLAVAISAAFYDLSWDGQWYHQVGVYRIAQGWNPLTAPLETFANHNNLWVRHYAKGPWYQGAAMMALTGHVEWGKFVTWLALAAAFMAVLAACLDAGMLRRRAVAAAAVIALNPVVCSEMVSFLVDGLMVCYLACAAAALFSGFRRPNWLVVVVGVAAAICSINSKFTGLVFLCFLLAGAGIYSLLQRRDLFGRFLAASVAALVLGTVGWGYNPYITNTVYRHHPFYPLMGTKAFPSLPQQDNDLIERYETPHNLMGRNRFVRFGYAIFGRPGAQPYNNDPDARLMWPFGVRLQDLSMYHFHETRIAGFGPFFSGVWLISLLLTGWLLWRHGLRILLIVGSVTLAASLLVSIHLWWARYGPQLWWLPMIPILAAFYLSRSRAQVVVAWGLVGILTVNALIVAVVRMHWEVNGTRTLNRQLTAIQASGCPIDIDFQYFGEPVGERLKTWGIPFHPVRDYEVRDGQELISVVNGYPGGIHYRIVQASTLSQK